jgi:broad specificity phosphatase PhoE
MKVHFLRHAESIFNRDLISEKDCALTEKGIEQASQVEGQYDIIICSMMKRTCQTLENSKLKHGRLLFTDLCREKKTTICDYLPHEDETIIDTDKQLEQQIQRFTCFLKSQVSPYNNVLVVSHGDFIHAVGKKSQPYPNNAEIQVHEI